MAALLDKLLVPEWRAAKRWLSLQLQALAFTLGAALELLQHIPLSQQAEMVQGWFGPWTGPLLMGLSAATTVGRLYKQNLDRVKSEQPTDPSQPA